MTEIQDAVLKTLFWTLEIGNCFVFRIDPPGTLRPWFGFSSLFSPDPETSIGKGI